MPKAVVPMVIDATFTEETPILKNGRIRRDVLVAAENVSLPSPSSTLNTDEDIVDAEFELIEGPNPRALRPSNDEIYQNGKPVFEVFFCTRGAGSFDDKWYIDRIFSDHEDAKNHALRLGNSNKKKSVKLYVRVVRSVWHEDRQVFLDMICYRTRDHSLFRRSTQKTPPKLLGFLAASPVCHKSSPKKSRFFLWLILGAAFLMLGALGVGVVLKFMI